MTSIDDAEAIVDCYKWVRWLEANGNSGALIELCEAAALSTMIDSNA